MYIELRWAKNQHRIEDLGKTISINAQHFRPEWFKMEINAIKGSSSSSSYGGYSVHRLPK